MSGSITITSKSKTSGGMDWNVSVTAVITPSSGCQVSDWQPIPYLQLFNSSNVQIGNSIDMIRQDSNPLTQPTTWKGSEMGLTDEPVSFRVNCWFLDAAGTSLPDTF